MASYEPKQWKCGDTITADDLNHMEEGIANAGGALVIRAQSFVNENGVATLTFDKTWQEVHDAIENGIPCYIGIKGTCDEGLCGMSDITELSPCMVPIYEAYSAKGTYGLVYSEAVEICLQSQTDPNALLQNVYKGCDAQ